MLKNFKARFKALKALLFTNEYFLVTADIDCTYSSPGCELNGPIVYKYFNNTDREMFYIFVNSYIDDNIIQDTGKFECVLDYQFNDGTRIKKGDIVNIRNRYIEVDNNMSDDIYSLLIPKSELRSHFIRISKI